MSNYLTESDLKKLNKLVADIDTGLDVAIKLGEDFAMDLYKESVSDKQVQLVHDLRVLKHIPKDNPMLTYQQSNEVVSNKMNYLYNLTMDSRANGYSKLIYLLTYNGLYTNEPARVREENLELYNDIVREYKKVRKLDRSSRIDFKAEISRKYR